VKALRECVELETVEGSKRCVGVGPGLQRPIGVGSYGSDSRIWIEENPTKERSIMEVTGIGFVPISALKRAL